MLVTTNVETVVLLSQQKPDDVIEVEKEPASYVSIAMRPGGLQDYVDVWNELN